MTHISTASFFFLNETCVFALFAFFSNQISQSLILFYMIYQKKKPSGQAEAIVKESIDSDKPIHAENRGSPGVAE